MAAESAGCVSGAARAAAVRYEIIVVDDSSTDDTGARAAASGATLVRVDRRQIAAARNAGAAVATGRTLVFVDADTLVTAAVIHAVREARAGGATAGGARVCFDEPLPRGARLFIAPWTFLYFRVLRFAAGCFIWADAATFRAVGGFDERYYASEEVHLSRTLKRRGPFVIVADPVTTSGRKLRTHTAREILGTLIRLGLNPRGLQRRKGLDAWYGARREDKP